MATHYDNGVNITSPGSSLPDGPHGGDGVRIAQYLGTDPASIIDLSASLNPFAPDASAIAARHLEALHRYPNPSAAEKKLADAIEIDASRLVLTNGGAEAIALVAADLGRGVVVEPEFSLYARHLPTAEPSTRTDPNVRWRSNPNNPLGHLAKADETALVWDEAFYPLATGRWSRGDATWRVGSLTKLWACPGLRLGYILAPRSTDAERVRARQPRWAVNGLAEAMVPELLDQTDLAGWHQKLVEHRSRFCGALHDLGLRTGAESTANWVLVNHKDNLRSRLAANGVIIRDCRSFGLTDTYRIAVPAPNKVDQVLTAIEDAALGEAGR